MTFSFPALLSKTKLIPVVRTLEQRILPRRRAADPKQPALGHHCHFEEGVESIVRIPGKQLQGIEPNLPHDGGGEGRRQ